jgi:uncharacterized FlgJ-related protein
MIPFKDFAKMSVHVRSFCEKYHDIAEIIAEKYGLNAAVALGQAAMESNYARSEACIKAHNFFGIKAQPGKPVWMDGDVAYRSFTSDSECWEEYGHMMTDTVNHTYYKALPWVSSIWHYADMLREEHYCPNPEYAGKVLGACKVFLDPGVAEIEEAKGWAERNEIIKPYTAKSWEEPVSRQQLAVMLKRYREKKGGPLESVV